MWRNLVTKILRSDSYSTSSSSSNSSDTQVIQNENNSENDSRYYKTHRSNMDVNLYATKKSVAQGMMDIALLTANASQLKYVLREGVEHRFYVVNVICLGISIILQILVGVLLILNTRYNINLVSHQARAENMNNFTIIGVFLITVANVFLSAFGTSP